MFRAHDAARVYALLSCCARSPERLFDPPIDDKVAIVLQNKKRVVVASGVRRPNSIREAVNDKIAVRLHDSARHRMPGGVRSPNRPVSLPPVVEDQVSVRL